MNTEEIVDAFRELGSPFIADGMQKVGLPRRIADPGLRPLLPDRRIAGTIVTMLIEYRPVAQPPTAYAYAAVFERAKAVTSPILVTECRLGQRSPHGGGACRSFLHAGIAGVITDGFIRDTADIRAHGLQTFHRGISPDSFVVSRLPEGYVGAEADVEIQVGGIVVAPGDLVIADEDGIVFCRPEDAPAVIAAAREILAEEEEIFLKWDAGVGYLEGLELRQDLDPT